MPNGRARKATPITRPIGARAGRFFLEAYPELVAQTKLRLASFLGTSADGVALVRNTTEGVNAILSSIDWQPDDEILVSNHTYLHAIRLRSIRRGETDFG